MILKTLFRLAPLLLSALLFGCAQNPPKTEPAKPGFAPAGGGFSAQMPATKERISADGTHMFAVQVGNLAYVVGYNELPADLKLTASIRKRLMDTSRDNMVRKAGTIVLSEQETTLDGRPARDMRMEPRKGYYMRLENAFNAHRLYHVGVVAPMGQSKAPEIAEFINSFRFTGK